MPTIYNMQTKLPAGTWTLISAAAARAGVTPEDWLIAAIHRCAEDMAPPSHPTQTDTGDLTP